MSEATCPSCGKAFDDAGDGICPHCGAQAGTAPPTVDLPPPGSVAGSTDALPPPDAPSAAFGETPRIGPPATPTGAPLFPESPRYKPLGELGRGGMGVVYKAHDSKLNRVVALKVLIAGEGASEEQVRRFFQEATSAARLKHPNIIPIHELDVKEGRHYFTMDFVEGGPLSKLIAERKLTPRRAVEILEQVARAVHHAHEHGVIHRDLKPSNIIVTPEGRPMVMDFGLAKEVESDKKLTQTGVAMGTPEYMAPEQARGDTRAADARTDVWALGAVLYEMVTGLPPFVGATGYEIVSKVVYDDPIPPRRFSRSCPRDVETIALKCLEKDPGRRYQTAQELAGDCRRFLGDEAIAARPASLVYRTRKKLARHKAVSIVSALALATVIGLTGWYVSSLRRSLRETERERDRAVEAEKKEAEERRAAEEERGRAALAKREAEAAAAQELVQRRQAEANLERAEAEIYRYSIAEADRLSADGKSLQALELLEALPDRFRGWEYYHLAYRVNHGAYAVQWRQALPSTARVVAFSPDGSLVATGCADGVLTVHEVGTGRMLQSFGVVWGAERSHPLYAGLKGFPAIYFSPDGRRLCCSGKTGKAWDCETWQEVDLAGDADAPMVFVPDGKGTLTGWNADASRRVVVLRGHSKRILALAHDPERRRIATASEDSTVMVWDVLTGSELVREHLPTSALALAFSQDGRRLAIGIATGRAMILDMDAGEDAPEWPADEGFFSAIALNPRGELLATTAILGNTVKVWEVGTGKQLMTLGGHDGMVCSMAYSPDGRWFASAGRDLIMWKAETGQAYRDLFAGLTGFAPVAVSRNRARLALIDDNATVIRLHDVSTCREISTLKADSGFAWSVALSPDGKLVGTGGRDGKVRLWETATGRPAAVLPGHVDQVQCVTFSPSGDKVASGSFDKTVRVWDAAKGAGLFRFEGHDAVLHSVAFSPDEAYLASGDNSGIVKLWNLRDGHETGDFVAGFGFVGALAFSPDGRHLIAGGQDGAMAIWGLGVKGGPLTCKGGGGTIYSVAVSPEGRRFFTGNHDGSVEVRDLATGRLLLKLKTHTLPIRKVQMSMDGKSLLSLGRDGRACVWPTEGWPQALPKRPEPVRIEIKPVPEARPEGAGKADEQF